MVPRWEQIEGWWGLKESGFSIEAVRQWKYRPYLLNGEAIEVETTVTVNFSLAE
jgi:hypothetical protein